MPGVAPRFTALNVAVVPPEKFGCWIAGLSVFVHVAIDFSPYLAARDSEDVVPQTEHVLNLSR